MDTLNQPPSPQPPDEQTPAPPKPPFNSKTLLIVLAVLVFMLPFIWISWLYLSVILDKITQSQPLPVTARPHLIKTPSPAPDPTANWKTYTNSAYGYSLRYPLDVKIDSTNEEAVSFYRNEIAKQGAGGQGRCCGMTVYLRTYESVNLETQTRPIENITIAGYSAIKWTDNPPFLEDIWIQNPNQKSAVKITVSTLNAIDLYKESDYELFNQILSTFRFTQ